MAAKDFVLCRVSNGKLATNASDIDLPALASSLRVGDTLLVKGSNGVFWKHQFVQQLVDVIKTSH